MTRHTLRWLWPLFAMGFACTAPDAPRKPFVVRFAGGTPTSFSGHMAQLYASTMPNGTVEKVELRQSAAVRALLAGSVDVMMATADQVYLTHRSASSARTDVRALASVHIVQLHLLARKGGPVRSLADVASTRAAVSDTFPVTALVAAAAGVDHPQWPFGSRNSFGRALHDGKLDAALVAASAPSQSVSDAIADGTRLLPIDGPLVGRLLSENPFLRRAIIRAHTYPGQTEPVDTIGVDRLFVCRSDLPDEIAYNLTRQLFRVLPRLAVRFPSLREMDMDNIPATPIPLHRGAARYYREWELLR